MHYGDTEQVDSHELLLVVYKHGTSVSKSASSKKDGTHRRVSVDYEISSIQSCKYFPVWVLIGILNNPYEYLNTELSKYKFEEWYELKIKMGIGNKRIEVLSVENVSEHKNEFKRLH